MSVRILTNREDDMACFYCSTTMWAFGPIMENECEAEGFLAFISTDPRDYKDNELEAKYSEFKRTHKPCKECETAYTPDADGLCDKCREYLAECAEDDAEFERRTRG